MNRQLSSDRRSVLSRSGPRLLLVLAISGALLGVLALLSQMSAPQQPTPAKMVEFEMLSPGLQESIQRLVQGLYPQGNARPISYDPESRRLVLDARATPTAPPSRVELVVENLPTTSPPLKDGVRPAPARPPRRAADEVDKTTVIPQEPHYLPGEDIAIILRRLPAQSIISQVQLLGPLGEPVAFREKSRNSSHLTIAQEPSMASGVYRLRLTALTPEVKVYETTFSLGHGVANTPRGVYLPGEAVPIRVGLIDSKGNKYTNAALQVQVTSPSGAIDTLSPREADDGEYLALYTGREAGTHRITATAPGAQPVVGWFEVAHRLPAFTVERESPSVVDVSTYEMKLRVTAHQPLLGATLVERPPWQLTLRSASARLDQSPRERILSWSIGDLQPGETRTLTYRYITPDISPSIIAWEPAEVIHKGGSASERGDWRLAVDATFHSMLPRFNWTNGTANNQASTSQNYYPFVHPKSLCRGQMYNLSWLIDNHGDDAIPTQTFSLQVKRTTDVAYSNLPAFGWDFWGGDTNTKTLMMVIGDDLASWQFGHNITPTTSTDTGSYSIRLKPATATGIRFESNVVDVEVHDCSGGDAALANRSIRIFPPTLGPDPQNPGEGWKDIWSIPERMLPGQMNFVVLSVANYNATFNKTTNFTMEVVDSSGTLMNWTTIENRTRTVQMEKGNISTWDHVPNASSGLANITNLTWRVLVPPDAATSQTYTLRIRRNNTSAEVYTKDFELMQIPIIVYQSAPNQVQSRMATGPERDKRFISLCNIGNNPVEFDSVRETNVLQSSAAPAVIHNAFVGAPTITGTSSIEWTNQNIPPATCRYAAISYSPEAQAGGLEEFILVVNGSDTLGTTYSFSDTFTPQMTGRNSNSCIAMMVNNSTRNGTGVNQLSDQYELYLWEACEAGDADSIQLHAVDIYIPPAFQRLTNVSEELCLTTGGEPNNNPLSGCSFRDSSAVRPDAGFPIGSDDEGWHIRYTFVRNGTTACAEPSTSPGCLGSANDADGEGSTFRISWNATLTGPPTYPPGPKTILVETIAWAGVAKTWQHSVHSAHVMVDGPWPMADAYSNSSAATSPTNATKNGSTLDFTTDTGSTGYANARGLPTNELSCANFSVSYKLFNIGNAPFDGNFTHFWANATSGPGLWANASLALLNYSNNTTLTSLGYFGGGWNNTTKFSLDNAIHLNATGEASPTLFNFTYETPWNLSSTFRDVNDLDNTSMMFRAETGNQSTAGRGLNLTHPRYWVPFACGVALNTTPLLCASSTAPDPVSCASAFTSKINSVTAYTRNDGAGDGNLTMQLNIYPVDSPTDPFPTITSQVVNKGTVGRNGTSGTNASNTWSVSFPDGACGKTYNISVSATATTGYNTTLNTTSSNKSTITQTIACPVAPVNYTNLMVRTQAENYSDPSGPDEGWGVPMWNFSVYLNHTNQSGQRNITAQLWVKDGGTGGSYRMYNSTRIDTSDCCGAGKYMDHYNSTNGLWYNYTNFNVSNFSRNNISGSQGAIVYFQFYNGSDDAGSTSTRTFTIEKDDVVFVPQANYTRSNSTFNSTVNRSDSEATSTITLVTKLRDENNSLAMPNTNGTLYITRDNTTYTAFGGLTLDGDSNFTQAWNPDCNYQNGTQKWKVIVNGTTGSTGRPIAWSSGSQQEAYIANDTREEGYHGIPPTVWYDSTTPGGMEYNVTVLGSLTVLDYQTTADTDPQTGHPTVGQFDTVDITAALENDCNEPINLSRWGGSMEFRIQNNRTYHNYTCANNTGWSPNSGTNAVRRIGANTYTCTFNATVAGQAGSPMPRGNYN
ncbi:MAG: hypothetical protein HY558_00735, partial [Euryarchaeota archaeon]|nr:hypothetical protein [Euryarchaeota archaeon]